MIRAARMFFLTPMLLFSSIGVSSCTTHDTKLEQMVSKTSPEPALLSAGVRAISASESQASITSLVFFVSNESETDLPLLIWNTPIEIPLSADVFTVMLNGEQLEYQGRMIKRGSPAPEHYRTIEAGESLETLVELANYYDMSSAGSYKVRFDPIDINGTYQLNDQTPINFIPQTVTITVP